MRMSSSHIRWKPLATRIRASLKRGRWRRRLGSRMRSIARTMPGSSSTTSTRGRVGAGPTGWFSEVGSSTRTAVPVAGVLCNPSSGAFGR